MDINKVIAKLPSGYVDDAAGWDEKKLRDEIVKADAQTAETEREMKNDEKLTGAKDLVKDLSGAYNDAKKAQRAKVAYCLHLLAERGKPVDTSSEADANT